MRHIIYSTYKDILHEMEKLTSSSSYKDLLSIVINHLINTTMNDKFHLNRLNLFGYKIAKKTINELGLNEETCSTINNSFYYEKMYQDSRKSVEETIYHLKINKEEINIEAFSEYIMKVYRKKLKDHIAVEAKKILKVFDHIGFIDFLDIDIPFLSYDNNSVLFSIYFESKEYVESLDNECFISDFGKTLHFVTDENVKYVNDVLSITEKKAADKTHNLITKDVLQEIKYMAYIIEQLKEKGITTNTYNTKKIAYSKLIKKGHKFFGVDIPRNFPYENPSNLYREIDYLLSKLLLSNAQKKAFYNEFNIRNKIPKITETEEHFHENDTDKLKSYLVNESLFNGQDGEVFEEDYLNLCKKHNIKMIEKKPETNDVSLDKMDDFSFPKKSYEEQLRQYNFLQNKFLNHSNGKKSILDELGLDNDTFDWYQK